MTVGLGLAVCALAWSPAQARQLSIQESAHPVNLVVESR
jgi:hypothetical protein